VRASRSRWRRRYVVTVVGSGADAALLVDSDLGSSDFTIADPLPAPEASGPRGGLSAPMPALVVRVLVDPGDSVEEGTPLMVLEAMKMEHTITSPHAGVVTSLLVAEGDQVERGAVLAAVVDPDAGQTPM
jgi:biotin carboxyl carrier protein